MPRPLAVAALGLATAVLAACSSTVGGHGAATSAERGTTSPSTAPGTASGGPFGTSTTPSDGSVATDSTPPSTPTVTVTASPSAPATIVSGDPGIFVGTWTGHGRRLVVHGDGSAHVDYRLYRTCGTDAPPCDRIEGNSIIDGGHVTLQTQRVVTAHHTSTLTATVVTSTDPTYRVGTTQTFTLRGDIISSSWATFCDAKSDGQCGA